MEDHTYSLGTNNCPSTDEFVVEPCLTACTPLSEDQPVLAESDVVQNEMVIDAANPASSDQADDALSDSGSLYCLSSVSDGESATDDEFSSCTAPSLWKKNILSLKVSFINCSKIVSIAVVLLIAQLNNAWEVWLQLLQTVLMDILYCGNRNLQSMELQQGTYLS